MATIAPPTITTRPPAVDALRIARRRRPAPSAPRLTVTVSDRWEDVEEGLSVVHDGFVEAGYMSPQPSGRRMIAQYLNPGTTFIVARMDDAPVGVMAVLPDGPFGLPSDRTFREEIDALRIDSAPLFEAGSFVVRAAWRRHTRGITANLFAAAIRVMRESRGFRVVLSVEPRQEGFYAGAINALRVADDRPLFGAPAALLVSDYARMLDAMLTHGTNGERMLGDLVLGDPTGWCEDRRSGEPWPVARLAELVAEQGALDPMLEQMRLLASTYPGLLAAA
ncbi:MAG: hypothetical protein AB1416_06160 [Actinomycetota bacterium]